MKIKVKYVLSITIILMMISENCSGIVENSLDSVLNGYETSLKMYKEMQDRYQEQTQSYNEIIDALKQEVECLQTDLQNKTDSYESQSKLKNEQTAVFESDIHNKNEEIFMLNKLLIETQNKLSSSENTIVRLERQLTNKQSELDEKIKEIEKQSVEMESQYRKEHEILKTDLINNHNNNNKVIIEQNQEIHNLNAQIIANADKLNELNEIIASYASCCKATSCKPFGSSSNIHAIQVTGVGLFRVLCDGQLNGPGWTVIQRRINGNVDFYRNWTEYRDGFGDLSGEFFIGLEKLHHMTKLEPQELFIYLEDFEGETRFAHYDKFEVDSEGESYALKALGTYTGNITDHLRLNEGSKFSTFDQDNDKLSGNCAKKLHGAWWYNKCGLINLNGRYKNDDMIIDNAKEGIYWDDDWHGFEYSLKSVQIMIRAIQQ